MDTSTWVEKTAVVASKVGLHARPAAVFVKTAKEYSCEITIGRPGRPGEEPVSARSMLKLLTLAVGHGEEVVVAARGERADAAVAALVDLLAHSDD